MEIIFFSILLALSLVLITLGLFRPEHSELSIIGFAFLFLLSFLIIGDDLQYKSGVDINTTSDTSYFTGINITEPYNSTTVINTIERNVYNSYSMGGTLSHSFGYWLAILSVIGFIGVIVGAKKPKW